MAVVAALLVVLAAACGSSGNAKTPGRLALRPVECLMPAYHGPPLDTGELTSSLCTAADRARIPDSTPSALATGDVLLTQGSSRYLLGPVDLDGPVVAKASVAQEPPDLWVVNLSLTSEGGRELDRIAAARYAHYHASAGTPDPQSLEAVLVDGRLLSVPLIQAPSFQGQIQISGTFTKKQAEQLATSLAG